LKVRRSWHENPLYKSAKRLAFEVSFRTGALGLFRHYHRHSVLVLIYHDILPPGFPQDNPLFGMSVSTDEFEWQLEYLQRHYNPITFQQLLEWLLADGWLPPRPVLITFDDGHKNNYQFALPALTKRNMSAVCFVVAENLGLKQLTWFEDAYYRLMFSPSTMWKVRNGERWDLSDKKQRTAACGRFFTVCRNLSESEQQQELASLREQLPVQPVDGKFPGRFEFLSVEDLQAMQQHGIEIGAHTMTHPILAQLEPDASNREIALSKSRLQEQSGIPVRGFAYPFGAPQLDFTHREQDYVRQSGFSLAFAGEGGLVKRGSDPFNLPRVGVGKMSRAQFVAAITGATASLKSFFSVGH
jgi:peptidoglycan/xylan/chitin deacetylase (PgdA/CDA1 family)